MNRTIKFLVSATTLLVIVGFSTLGFAYLVLAR